MGSVSKNQGRSQWGTEGRGGDPPLKDHKLQFYRKFVMIKTIDKAIGFFL